MTQHRNNYPAPITIVDTIKQAHQLHEIWGKKLIKGNYAY